MGDIFDQIAGVEDSGSSQGDIFDQIAGYDPSADSETTVGSVLGNAGKSAVKGALNTLSLIADYNPLSSSGMIRGSDVVRRGVNYLTGSDTQPSMEQLASEQTAVAPRIDKARVDYIGEPTPTSTLERYADKGIEMLASAPASSVGGIVSALSSGVGGEVAKDLGAPEWVGQVGGGLLPSIVKGGAKLAVNALSNVPTEEEALLNAFKVTAKEAAPAQEGMRPKVGDSIRFMKDEGIITPASSSTPFADIRGNLENAISNREATVTDILDHASSITTKDILPSVDDFATGVQSGAKAEVIRKAVNTEREQILRTAIQKQFPERNPDEIVGIISGLRTRAASGDTKALSDLDWWDNQIMGASWSPHEVWSLRRQYDQIPNWDSKSGSLKGDVYEGMRSKLQGALLNSAGDDKAKLSEAFSDWSKFIKGQPSIEKMAGYELKGKTQRAPIGQRVIAPTVRTAANKYLGIGHQPAQSPELLLKQAFGETLPQRLQNSSAMPPGNVAAGIASNALGSSESPSQEKSQQLTKSSDLPSNSTDNETLFKKVFQPEKSQSALDRVLSHSSNMEDTKTNDYEQVRKEIESNVLDKSIAQAESTDDMDPRAKNPNSSASGLFQLTSATAKALGVKDVFDPRQNYEGYLKLKAENVKRFGEDPSLIYAAHFLGAPLLAKVLADKPLTEDEQAIVNELKSSALPRFLKIYQRNLKSQSIVYQRNLKSQSIEA